MNPGVLILGGLVSLYLLMGKEKPEQLPGDNPIIPKKKKPRTKKKKRCG